MTLTQAELLRRHKLLRRDPYLDDKVVFILESLFPLASDEIQRAYEPGWDGDPSGFNPLYLLPNDYVVFWQDDGLDALDGRVLTGIAVYPISCFIGKAPGQAKLTGGFVIDQEKPGWRIRLNAFIQGKMVPGIERLK